MKINVIIKRNIIAAVEKFEGKIKNTTNIIGIHNGIMVLEKLIFLL